MADIFHGQYSPAGGEPVSAGARSLAESLPSEPLPEAVVLLDFVGATGQRFPIDDNSDPALSEALWSLGKRFGSQAWFLPETRGVVDNGLLAFRQRGIRAIISPVPTIHTAAPSTTRGQGRWGQFLERVGWLLQAYLEKQAPS